jgi:FG-GAP repeat
VYWAQKAKFTDPSAAPNDCLGFSVAITGQTALVGLPHHNNLHGQVDLFPL